MQISLEHTAKRFGDEWIFRELSLEFKTPGHYALLGSNGSGKSTLLQAIAGAIAFSRGQIRYLDEGKELGELFFRECSFSAPYLELIEEFTLVEMLHFHFSFKAIKKRFNAADVIREMKLDGQEQKKISGFSSGMKQRLKLGLSVFADTKVLLLDEPCTNLDAQGEAWYKSIIREHCAHQLVIVASNQPAEYDFCTEFIRLEDFKTKKT